MPIREASAVSSEEMSRSMDWKPMPTKMEAPSRKRATGLMQSLRLTRSRISLQVSSGLGAGAAEAVSPSSASSSWAATGAASRIGLAIAKRLAREGAQLALLDENPHKMETIDRESFGPDCRLLTVSCNLCDSRQIRAAVDTISTEWGGLDVLVNSAGNAFYGSTQAMSQEDWQRLLDVSLLGPVELTRLLLPLLLDAEEAHVLNVSSVYGFLATNRCTAHHLTKFGLLGFSEALRAEFAHGRLGVTVLCPDFVA